MHQDHTLPSSIAAPPPQRQTHAPYQVSSVATATTTAASARPAATAAAAHYHQGNPQGGHHHQSHHHHHHHRKETDSVVPPGCVPPSIITLPDGRQAMIVVDPITRKLTIPLEHISETKALVRNSIPSLCQLFLAGRCRQYNLCHQVHADPYVIQALRVQVERLPLCCVEHGDDDFTCGFGEQRCVKLTGRGGGEAGRIVSLRNLSATQGLRQILQSTAQEYRGQQLPIIIDLAHHNISLCRLHLVDRCRFAEDCKFLHVCKELVRPEDVPHPAAVPPAAPGHISAAAVLPTATVGLLPSYHASHPHLVSVHTNDGSGRAATPPSPDLLHLEAATLMNSSGFMSGSFASQSSTPSKKYRTDSSWSYDPYLNNCFAHPMLVDAVAS